MVMFINGLKYIIPCQSRFSPFQALEHIFHEYQSENISKKLKIRAQREHKIVQYVQRLIRQQSDIVIRRTDKSKVFYIGKAADFERKAEEYMLKTEAYEEIKNGRCPLADNLYAIQTVLDYLVMKKALTKKQSNRLIPKLNSLELGHYHGIPKPHKPETPLRPIVASIHAPATLASKFLNDVLAPIYLKVNRKYTFINDIDVIRQLEQYAADGYLTPRTKFITIDVENLYTMIPRDGALTALGRFCIKYCYQGKIGTFTIDHIMKMARLILDTNCFAYNNKYYKQIRGGAMGSAFTQVLANIYLMDWEQDLIQHQIEHNEVYGRYIDDIFMTTNKTTDEINIELEKAKHKDINIKIEPTISKSVHYLDVVITNENGHLRTSMFHKPTAEPYILPCESDHPRHIHRNIVYAGLLRAARICSHVNDFNSECVRIDLSLLLNGYPPHFITEQVTRFFHLNNALLILQQLNEHVYSRLHHNLLYQPTLSEKKFQTMMEDPIKTPLVLQPKIWNKEIMYPRYLFDTSLTINFRQEFTNWWKTLCIFRITT
ncbi:unnamed protein product [Adineta steineri]|uniref:Reverse transcriptase domain-containing protein n=1 Tax=Adineta steineri TaxID=433720 RepID=A0A814L002_9BILA|nr:unnamed protein product [Adineta steineri]